MAHRGILAASLVALLTASPALSAAVKPLPDLTVNQSSQAVLVNGKLTSAFNGAVRGGATRGGLGRSTATAPKPPTTPPALTHRPRNLSPGPAWPSLGSGGGGVKVPPARTTTAGVPPRGGLTPRFNSAARPSQTFSSNVGRTQGPVGPRKGQGLSPVFNNAANPPRTLTSTFNGASRR